jgi:hypothetical protein
MGSKGNASSNDVIKFIACLVKNLLWEFIYHAPNMLNEINTNNEPKITDFGKERQIITPAVMPINKP